MRGLSVGGARSSYYNSMKKSIRLSSNCLLGVSPKLSLNSDGRMELIQEDDELDASPKDNIIPPVMRRSAMGSTSMVSVRRRT